MTPGRGSALGRFFLTQFLLEVQFWFPVWLIFLTDRGFTVTVAVLADGLFRLTMVGTELPLGVLADRIGRRRAYLLLCGATPVTYTTVALVDDLPTLIVAWVLWGLLWALASGMGAAYLYELLHREGRTAERVAVFGRWRGVVSGAVLVSHLSAGLLYTLHPVTPWAVTAALGVAATALAWRLPDVRTAGGGRPAPTVGGILKTLGARWQRRDVRDRMVVLGLLLVVGWSPRILFQPLLLDLGLSSLVSGLMYFGYSLLAIAAGLSASACQRRLGGPATVRMGVILMVVAVAGIGLWPAAGPMLLVPLIGYGHHLADTVMTVDLNDRVDDRVRATVGSAVSFGGGLMIAFTRPGLGAVADRVSAAAAFRLWAVVGAVAAAVVWRLVRPPGPVEGR